MARKFSFYRYPFLVSLILLSFATAPTVFSQHEGHNMPGMSKPKPKPKAKVKRRSGSSRKRTVARKRTLPAKKHDLNNMPGMQMPASSPSTNPAAAPEKMEMNMPMPSASPGAAPHVHLPGMQMPTSSPSPNPPASPEKMDMNTPMPFSSRSLSDLADRRYFFKRVKLTKASRSSTGKVVLTSLHPVNGNGLEGESQAGLGPDHTISWNKTQTTLTIPDHYDHARAHSFVSAVCY